MPSRFLNNININDEYSLPNADGSADQIITTDGAGQLSFVDQSTINAGNAEHVVIYAKNTSGSQINKGTPVYITGTVGATDTVQIAPADASDSAKMPAVGLLDDTLAINAFGYVITGGFMDNITTDPIDGAQPASNDTVYVKVGGGLTLTKPTGPTGLIQNIAKVGKVSGGNSGSLIVSSILRTNDVPNLTTGKIWVGDGNTTESTVVHLDETNGRMGIGTTSPGYKLDVNGGAQFNTNTGSTPFYITRLGNSGESLRIYTGDSGSVLETIQDENTGSYGSMVFKLDAGAPSPVFEFQYGSAVRTVIQGGTGNVGIGTTVPDAKLQVVRSAALPNGTNNDSGNWIESAAFRVTSGNNGLSVGVSNVANSRTSWIQSGHRDTQYASSLSDSELLLQPLGGNVGIGTTSPGVKLHLSTGNSSLPSLDGGTLFVVDATQGSTGNYSAVSILSGTAGVSSLYLGDSDAENRGSLRYNNSSNSLSLGTNGSEKLRITSAGNVGIGTTSPAGPLTVANANNGNWNDGLIIDDPTGWAATVYKRSNVPKMFTGLYSGNDNYIWMSTGYDNTGTTITAPRTDAVLMARPGTDDLQIYLDTHFGGNVGIGTTSPTRKLNVNGNVGINNQLLLDSANYGEHLAIRRGIYGYDTIITGTRVDYSPTSSTNTFKFLADLQTTGQLNVTGNSIINGNVGIGTTSPNNFGFLEKVLNISAGSSSSTTLQQAGIVISGSSDGDDADDFGYLSFTNYQSAITNDRVAEIRALKNGTNVDTGEFAFYTSSGSGPAERMRITSSGNVGIGITNPNTKLHVGGIVQVTESSNTAFYGGNYVRMFSDQNYGFRNSGGTYIANISMSGNSYFNGGNVGIGTTNPSEKLEVAGNARITGDVTLSNGNALRWTSDDVRIEGTTAGDNIKFYVANTEILQLAQSGTLATVTGNLRVTGAYYDSNNLPGTSGQVLSSTATGTDWVSLSEISGVDGTGTTNYVAKWSDTDTIGNSIIYDNGSSVGVATASPHVANKLEVNGQARVYGQMMIGNSSTSNVAGATLHLKNSGAAVLRLEDLDSTNLYYDIKSDFGNGLIISEGSSERMRIDTSGNVGIGTTSPSAKLQISTTMTSSPTSNIFLDVDGSNTTGGGGSIIFGTSATAGSTTSYNAKITGTRVAGGLGGDSELGFWTTLVSDTTTAQQRMTITKEGNVGIGTTSPGAKLEVNNSSISGKLLKIGQDSSGYWEFLNAGNPTSRVALLAKDSSGVTKISINPTSNSYFNNGNVGIGTTSPQRALEVVGQIRVSESIEWGWGGVRIIGSTVTNDFRVQTWNGSSPEDRLIVNGSGNVGIGTTAPSAKLNSISPNGSTNSLRLGRSDASNYWDFNHAGNDLRIFNTAGSGSDVLIGPNSGGTDQGNRVGIGTATPTQRLHVNGNARVTGAYYDSNNSAGTSGQVLSSTATGTDWVSLSEISGVDGTGTANTVAMWSDSDTITDAPITFSVNNATFAGSIYSGSTIGNLTGGSLGQQLELGNSSITTLRFDADAWRVYAGGSGSSGEALRVTEAGNVGIGQTNPGAKLHITNGNILVNGSGVRQINIESTNDEVRFGLKGNNGNQFRFTSDGTHFKLNDAGKERIKVTNAGDITFGGRDSGNNQATWMILKDQTGNVGIGTTSPTHLLNLSESDSNSVQLVIDNTNTTDAGTETSEIRFRHYRSYVAGQNDAGEIIVGKEQAWDAAGDRNSYMSFGTRKGSDGVVEKMRITSTGNVGIGTTSPSAKLEVYDGDIKLNDSTRNLLIGEEGSSSYQIKSSGYLIVDATSGIQINKTTSGNVTIGSGNVGIGTTSPNYKLEVNGGARAGGVVTYSKTYSSLDTTGNAVAGLTTGYNGNSTGFTFTCFGHTGDYQKIVYSCYNGAGTWYTKKVIDEGTNAFDVEASANATTITFTFKSTSGTKHYTPRVTVEATGHEINSTYA